MKIVSIFGSKLFAFHFKGQRVNEYRRLLKLWTDPVYLYGFFKQNAADLPGNRSPEELVEIIAENAATIDAKIIECAKDEKRDLDEFFKPLYNAEYQVRILSLRKGREQYLRLYAVKIADNCFVITGGAIKFTHLMQERDHTQTELDKLKQCRDYLNQQGVFDEDSFYEMINEQDND